MPARGYGHKYTKYEDEFIIDNFNNMTYEKLAFSFNEKFGTDITPKALAHRRAKLGLKKDNNPGYFNKGHIPENGYQKGHIPPRWQEIGTEKIRNNSGTEYVYVKYQDKNGINNWKAKQVFMYEQYHNCKIEKGYAVIFADGNTKNFEKDNLILVTRAELVVLNKNKLRKNDKELTKCGVNIAKMQIKINKLKKEK